MSISLDRQPNYSKIPSLAEQAIAGRAGRATQARQELMELVARDPNYDSTVIAIVGVQRVMTKRPSSIEAGREFLEELMLKAKLGGMDAGRKTLHLTPQVYSAALDISLLDKQLRKNPFLRKPLPENYSRFVQSTTEWIKDASAQGQSTVEITFARSIRPGENKDQYIKLSQQYSEWMIRMGMLFEGLDVFKPEDYEKRDLMVDFLVYEPEQDIYSEKRLFSSRYGKLTLEELGTSSLPITPDSFSDYLDYLDNLLSSNPSKQTSGIIRELFFSSIQYRDIREDHQYRNYSLFSRLSYLQNQLGLFLINGSEDPIIEKNGANVIRKLSGDQALTFLIALFQWNTRPHLVDPELTNLEQEGAHPIYKRAMLDYLNNYPDGLIPFAYGDEISRNYFEEKTLPQIEERLKQLGADGNFQQPLVVFKELLSRMPFENEHLLMVQDCFQRNCGDTLLKKLDQKVPEVKEVTKVVWDSIIEQGMHYLPALSGEDKVLFSEESLPHLLGLESVSFHLRGSLEDWQIIVVFDIANSNLKLLSKLDNNGDISFRAPIDQAMPGLSTMLRHIAVLTFHDLVIQAQKKPAEARTSKNNSFSKGEINFTNKKDVVIAPLRVNKTSSTNTALPRIQSDASLVKDASVGATYASRLVHLHAMWPSGAKAYYEAYKEYQQAKEEDAPEFTLNMLKENLAELRKKMYRPDPAKISTFPAHLEQVEITDPETDKSLPLKTWVLEHSSPRLTDEELRSPIKQYKRYYSDSSGLASLEPMKIWLFEVA